MSVARAQGALLLAAMLALGATSTTWEVTGFADFSKGRLSGLSLTSEGTLEPGPAILFNARLDQPAVWSVAVGTEGAIYAATGHQGKVFRISPDGKVSTAWSAEQSEIFALCTDAKGVLYAGSSPNGGLYRIENGHARELWHSSAKYIWSIRAAPDGTLYVATGEQGAIYRVKPNGAADVYYETGQSNVTALALASNGDLYAGTEPNGLLYDITGPGKATILMNSTLPEVRSIAVDANGVIYVAAMGGAVTTRSASTGSASTVSSGTVVATTPTVITVTEAKRSGVPTENEQANIKPSDQTRITGSTAATSTGSNAAVVEVSGVEKSAIYKITSDRTVEILRSSKDDNVFDILLDGDSLIFSTDDHGRIYRLNGQKTTLLAEPGDGETTRIVQAGSVVYAALSNPGRLLALGPPGSAPGAYQSQVHDATSVARWGHLQWRGKQSGVVFRTRTGNSTRPDATWSAWSEPISDSGDNLIKSPPARFIQWRAEWPAGSSAEITSVDVPYLPQNGPPVIHSITVTSIVGTNAAKSPGNVSAASSAYSVTVTDTGEAPATGASTTGTQTVSRLQTTQTQISWQADDPDGDKLAYSVYFRAEDETNWQLIRSRMFENTLLLDPDVLADGRYLFRVVASDAPSNAAQYARKTEMVSTPVLIDNTPPVVTVGPPHRDGASLDVDVDAHDATSSLRLCEYSLDAGYWQPIEAVDGVTDSPRERFHLHLDKLSPGEHLLVFRVYDAANNAGLARVVLK